MPSHTCHCGKPATHRCAGCRKGWYCSKDCQRDGWALHIFDCSPTKPIKTSHYLTRAILNDVIPEHPQACEDYGFSRASRKEMLLGVYVYLIKGKGIRAHVLHEWRSKGTLVENIIKQYEDLPYDRRGRCYEWFLQNKHVVRGEGSAKSLQTQEEEGRRHAWCFIGRPSTASDDEILRYVQSLPKDERDCFSLYSILLMGHYPGPGDPKWILFGFCGCRRQAHEREMYRVYKALIHQCTFAEFLDTYSSGSLPSLFESKGFKILDPVIVDVLDMKTHGHKSVWSLKDFVELNEIHGPWDTKKKCSRSVSADYGFSNCRSPEEQKLLLNLYKDFFSPRRSANPLELHQACTEGRLLSYFSEDLKFEMKPWKTYKRLLRNPYPLLSSLHYLLS